MGLCLTADQCHDACACRHRHRSSGERRPCWWVGLLALAAIGRQLWPDSPGSQVVALLCYLCSSQVVITGMTAYAVSAHLALNLVWLLLFMRGDRIDSPGR